MNTLVPMVVEQSNKGERAYDIYSRLLKEHQKHDHDHETDNINKDEAKPKTTKSKETTIKKVSKK